LIDLDDTGETLIFRDKNERDMEFESTMTSELEDSAKKMRDLLT
jgi:hypothetical protein